MSKLFREYFYLKFILDPEKGWKITDPVPYPDPAKMQNWFSEIISRNVVGKISVSLSAILRLDFENMFKKILLFTIFTILFLYRHRYRYRIWYTKFFFCFFEKIADTDTDIFPKTFLDIISENQFCILAGSRSGTGSVIFHLFSGSKMIFMLKYSLKSV